MGCTSRVFSAAGGCGLGGQLQRLMEVLHLRQGQSPRDAFEEFGSAQPQTRQNETKISMAAMVASCRWVSQSYMHQVHRSTLSTRNCPLGYPSATLRAHRDCFSYGNKGDCPGWWSPPSSVYLLPAGMNMSPVSRLKKTWAKVKTAKFFILEVNRIAGSRGVVIWPLNGATQMSPCLLPAPDGPNREFLQL